MYAFPIYVATPSSELGDSDDPPTGGAARQIARPPPWRRARGACVKSSSVCHHLSACVRRGHVINCVLINNIREHNHVMPGRANAVLQGPTVQRADRRTAPRGHPGRGRPAAGAIEL